jgi:hypothetical protein
LVEIGHKQLLDQKELLTFFNDKGWVVRGIVSKIATMSYWLVLPIALITAKGVPAFNVLTLCNRAIAATGSRSTVQACIRDERAARTKLFQQWALFSATEKSFCVTLSTTGGAGTYTDLLTCLQDARDARQIRQRDATLLRPAHSG